MINEYDKNILIALGKNIKLTRIKAGLIQEQLAEKVNLSIETIDSIERGNYKLLICKLNEIADALEIELYKLFIFD